jgi:hypothetical protein
MANSDKHIRKQLFEWFETGDRPSEEEFGNWLHSMVIQHDDQTWIEDDDPAYENFMGLGTTTPVGRLSLNGEGVIGAGWSGDRSIDDDLIPASGMLIEGGVKIGTFGDPTDPDFYKVHIKSTTSADTSSTPHQRPLNINSANHTMVVFSDTDGTDTTPYTIRDEGNHGFRFYSYDVGAAQETMEITFDGRVRINDPSAPEARVDVAGGNLPGMKITTTNNDQIRFDGAGTYPHTIVDQSNRGFRFFKEGVGERVRIADDGNVGINETNPQYKLQIGGDLALNPQGHMYGIRTDEPLKFHANTARTDGAAMEMHPYTYSGGGPISTGEINFISGSEEVESGFYFMQSKQNAPVNYPMVIQGDGQIGINLGLTNVSDPKRPTNIVHIKSDADGDTGLRLETGAAEGHILVSDDEGDSTWTSLSDMSKYGAVAFGTILMWGYVENLPIPDGWALCDGNAHNKSDGSGTVDTPNLAGVFVGGYDADAGSSPTGFGVTGNTGGQERVPLTAAQSGRSKHGHLLILNGHTDFDGAHEHNINTNDRTGSGNYVRRAGDSGHLQLPGLITGAHSEHKHPLSLTPTVTDSAGESAASDHENRPAYHVLAYIMKV